MCAAATARSHDPDGAVRSRPVDLWRHPCSAIAPYPPARPPPWPAHWPSAPARARGQHRHGGQRAASLRCDPTGTRTVEQGVLLQGVTLDVKSRSANAAASPPSWATHRAWSWRAARAACCCRRRVNTGKSGPRILLLASDTTLAGDRPITLSFECAARVGAAAVVPTARALPPDAGNGFPDAKTTMSDIGRIDLFGKLNALLYQGLESATAFCKLRGNPYVELVHWMHQILQGQDSDLHRIARRFELDAERLQADLAGALEQLPRGAGSVSDLSEHIDHAVERAWILASPALRPHAHTRRPPGAGAGQDLCAAQCAAGHVDAVLAHRARRAAGEPAGDRRGVAGGRRRTRPRRRPAAATAARRPARPCRRTRPGLGALCGRPDGQRAPRATSIPSPAATRKSARSSTS